MTHDVLIIGGGLVGASLALALDAHGLDVGLVETAPATALPPVFDERNLSLAETSVNALTRLGVLGALRKPTGAIRRIHISRRGDFGRVRLCAQDYGREQFGQVVVARDLGEALEARLSQLGTLTRYRPATYVSSELASTQDMGELRQVRLATDSGERIISTRLLVGADGTDSAVRASLGIGARRHDYGQRLVVCRMRAQAAPDGTAYERLGDDGPTAVLPRGDRHYGVIHAVAAHEAGAVAALGERAWCERVQRAFGWALGRWLGAGPRSHYAARLMVADALTAPRAVLLGNAAQTIHPIGAQGFNLGLRDALTLAECVAGGDDVGSIPMLEHYARRRAPDREETLKFSDGLARLTANPAPLLRPLRSLGLAALGQSATLREMLVSSAMGYRGEVPALCRPGGANAAA